jgi:solute carrier family 10 (sodium/bile acid cotransporter), member 7
VPRGHDFPPRRMSRWGDAIMDVSRLPRRMSGWERKATRYLQGIRIDWFAMSLAGTLLAATLLPCHGDSAQAFHAAGIMAIAALFFLQGARLSRDAILNGVMHWRLHAFVASTTFVLFPLIGLGLARLFPAVLPGSLWLGVLFICALPSTIQSSVALTSIARGNVPGAICSATLSNVAGIVLTPLLFTAMSRSRGSVFDLSGIWHVMAQLLVPFIFGHLLRPWLGQWAERNRPILAITDRASILLVVYSAFSGAVVLGVWDRLPPMLFVTLGLVTAVILGAVLLFLIGGSRALSFDRTDEPAIVFCGVQKSLVSGVPIANALFPASAVGLIMLPLLIYYPLQLLMCARLARRYATTDSRRVTRADALLTTSLAPIGTDHIADS